MDTHNPDSVLPRRRGKLPRRWLVAGIGVILIAVVGGLLIGGRLGAAAAAGPATVAVTRGNLIATVTGSGSIAAEQTLDLSFQAGGTVTRVLVDEGDSVAEGQALATLDDRNLTIQVESAKSALASAEARYEQTQKGNATAEEIAATEAQVQSAQVALAKASKGPTAQEQAAAVASVKSAQAAYDAAVRAAETSSSDLDSAAASLQKTLAALQQAQARYDQVKGQPNVGMLQQSLDLQNATTDYEQAKAKYESLNHTAVTDSQSKIESAAATLASAKKTLADLTPTSEDIASAQAALDQARANLAKLTAPASATDQAIQQAAVDQAQQSLAEAELNLDKATLKAPFSGIISRVDIVAGSQASSASPVMQIIDGDPLHVDMKLSENDVAQVREGQAVSITVDSLSAWSAQGAVDYIAPAAEANNGVVTYAVRVSFTNDDPQVKIGMTANLGIETTRKENVLLLPNAAILPKGSGHAVQMSALAQAGQASAVREIEVQTGLTDGTYTEIVSGLSEGQQVIALPSETTAKPAGPFGG